MVEHDYPDKGNKFTRPYVICWTTLYCWLLCITNIYHSNICYLTNIYKQVYNPLYGKWQIWQPNIPVSCKLWARNMKSTGICKQLSSAVLSKLCKLTSTIQTVDAQNIQLQMRQPSCTKCFTLKIWVKYDTNVPIKCLWAQQCYSLSTKFFIDM